MTNTTNTAKTTATKAVATCTCGCGLPLGGKSSYRPGHDAKHVSQLLAVIKTETKNVDSADAFVELVHTAADTLTSQALKSKLTAATMRWVYKSFDSDIAKDEASAKKHGTSKHTWTILFHPDDVSIDITRAVAKSVGLAVAPETAAADFEAPEVTEADEVAAEVMIEECFPVKIGRWTYPTRMVGGEMERNMKRDGSGEWVEYKG